MILQINTAMRSVKQPQCHPIMLTLQILSILPVPSRTCRRGWESLRWRSTNVGVRMRRGLSLAAVAMDRKVIDGATEEMNSIASQNLDHASARRRVHQAFSVAQQNLDHLLLKRAPMGIIMEERYDKNSKGVEVFWKSWSPKPDVNVKGSLFFCHGYGDTCTFFFEGIAKWIADAGYQVYAMDYPGFGLSQGLHGYIPSFDGMVDQVIEQYAILKAKKEANGIPNFLLGQSMGGAVALKAHLKQPQEWDGIILVAPMCRISKGVTPSDVILKAFTLMSYFLPEAKLFPITDTDNMIFRDPNKGKMYDYNVISYNDQMRLRTATELLKATSEVEAQLENVSAPLLILHGAADLITDPKASELLYKKSCSEDKTLKLYEDAYHCILEGEPDDRISSVISDIISWLDSHCIPG